MRENLLTHLFDDMVVRIDISLLPLILQLHKYDIIVYSHIKAESKHCSLSVVFFSQGIHVARLVRIEKAHGQEASAIA